MESPLAVANYFIQKSFATGIELTPMKLVKLVYIAHGWHLGLTGKPLLSEPVQAWKYGPVIPSVYRLFKKYADKQITSMQTDSNNTYPIVTSEEEVAFLDKIWDVYKNYNGIQLSTLTHQADTPWFEIWHKKNGKVLEGALIPNNVIEEHYKKKTATNVP